MRWTIALLLGVVCLSITACGPRRVRVDFTNYEKSYAVTSNHEVLLNLARLEERDPTYFFKLGQISSQYRMQASLTSTGSYLPVGSAGTNQLPGGVGGPGLVLENDPQFTMIPVDDQTLARLLLSPVPSDVFYDLYYQGWRVDQLFRLMVDRIEITLPNPNGNGCTVQIIRNEPPPVFRNGTPSIDYGHEQASIASYVNFLRISAVVYALQKYGYLQLRGATQFEPLDKNSWLPVESELASDESKAPASDTPQVTTVNGWTTVMVSVPGAKSGGGGNSAAPTAKEFDETAAKNEYWQQMEIPGPDGKPVNAWVLGQMAHRTIFQLTSGTANGNSAAKANPESAYGEHVQDIEDQLRAIFSADESLKGMEKAPELTDILEILYNGFSIEGQSDQQEIENGFCPVDWTKGAPSRLVLRSLIGVMAAAAQEEDAFKQLEADDPQILLKADEKGQPYPGELTATSNALEHELMAASQEFVEGRRQKPDVDQFSPLAQMTAKIHLGMVMLGVLQQQPKGKAVDEKAVMADVEKTLADPTSPYASRAIEFLVNAQSNEGEWGAFKGLVPLIERQPVLQIDWSPAKEIGEKPGQKRENVSNYLHPVGKASELKASGFMINYEGREFMVTDADLSGVNWSACEADAAARDGICYARENQYWNRNMFRLINELSSQVTVDISKFPLPAVLQLVP